MLLRSEHLWTKASNRSPTKLHVLANRRLDHSIIHCHNSSSVQPTDSSFHPHHVQRNVQFQFTIELTQLNKLKARNVHREPYRLRIQLLKYNSTRDNRRVLTDNIPTLANRRLDHSIIHCHNSSSVQPTDSKFDSAFSATSNSNSQ